MSSLSNFRNVKYKIGLGEAIYVLAGDSTTGGNAPAVTGEFVQTNNWISRTTYSDLYNNLSFVNTLTWTAVTSGTTSQLDAITFGNGIYIYGGAGGLIATSTDGTAWIPRTSGTTSQILSLGYNGSNLYIYVGAAGALATSTNGIAWTLGNSGTTDWLYSITYGNGIWVCGGNSGTLRTSVDGITWTPRTSGISGTLEIIYAGGQYVTGGFSGGLSTSSDGITWVSRVSGTVSNINGLAYGNGIYVYVTDGGGLATSTDAITWTARTSGTTSNITSVSFSNGLFVYVGALGLARSSTDGITWSAETASTGQWMNKIDTFSANRFFYVGNLGALGYVDNFAPTATNFYVRINPAQKLANLSGYDLSNVGRYYVKYTTTSESDLPVGTVVHNLLSYKANIEATDKYLKFPGIYSQSLYSALFSQIGKLGGANADVSSFSNVEIAALTFQSGIFVAGNTSGAIGTSTDGLSWTSRTSNSAGAFYDIIWDGTKYAATGNTVATSTDSITWNNYWPGGSSGGTNGLEYLAYSSSLNRVIGVGYSGIIITSDDAGQTWIRRTSPTTQVLYTVEWFSNVNLFIAVGASGTLITSPDGITWTSRTTGTTATLGGMAWTGTYFIIVNQTAGTFLRSTDGITWTLISGTGVTTVMAKVLANSTITVQYDSSGNVWTSPSNDLTTWTSRGACGSGTTTSGGAYSSSLGLFAIGGDTAIVTSPDGITWTARRATPNTCFEIIWSGTYFMVCSRDKVIKSTDGITWTDITADMTQTSSITFAGSNTVIVGSPFTNGPVLIRSTNDGTTWSASVIADNVTKIIKNVNDYVILRNASSKSIYKASSATGLGGIDTSAGLHNWLYGIFANGIYVIVGTAGKIRTSTDGVTWTSRTSGTTSQINAITFGNGLYVYGGTGGVLATSTDAITWNIQASRTTSQINTVAFANNLFVYAGVGGAFATSTDAVNWIIRSSGTTSQINELSYGNSLYVYAGVGGVTGNSPNPTQIAYSSFYNASSHFIIPSLTSDNSTNNRFYIKAKL